MKLFQFTRGPGGIRDIYFPWLEGPARWIFYFWFFRLTPMGRVLLLGLVISGFGGMISVAMPIYHLFGMLLTLYILAFVFGLFGAGTCVVDHDKEIQCCAGETVYLPLKITQLQGGAKEIAAGFFSLPRGVKSPLSDPSGINGADIPAAGLIVEMHPLKRGFHQLQPPRIYSCWPFHINRFELARGEKVLLKAYPSFHPLHSFMVPVGRLYQPGGIALTSNTGESPEYIGNREYRPGDLTRDIDFRAWGRIGKPVVREYQEEFYCRIGLILDTHVETKKQVPEGDPALESAISLVAAMADNLARGEYIIDLFAAGENLYVFRAGRSLARLDNVLEILACLEECHTNPFAEIGPALVDELQNITTVICVLLDWDKEREDFVRTIFESGSSARVFIVREGKPTLDPAAAEDWAGPIRVFSPKLIRDGKIEEL